MKNLINPLRQLFNHQSSKPNPEYEEISDTSKPNFEKPKEPYQTIEFFAKFVAVAKKICEEKYRYATAIEKYELEFKEGIKCYLTVDYGQFSGSYFIYSIGDKDVLTFSDNAVEVSHLWPLIYDKVDELYVIYKKEQKIKQAKLMELIKQCNVN